MAEAASGAEIARLLDIMAQLRTPGTGCPWDLEQTFETIAPYTIEEAYEVVDAIERGDMEHLVEELGDLLLQVVFHARMAEEAGHFTFDDVIEAICKKMIRRHPHVFGDETARDAGAVKGMWERIKSEEAKAKNNESQLGILESVPRALPGLIRAVKLQKKAARVGFDWNDIEPVFDKIREEIDELEQAFRSSDRTERRDEHTHEETGDLLFALANLARHMKIEPESALQDANAKFLRRFRFIEDELRNSGKSVESASLDEMDLLWDQSKGKGL